MERSEPVGSHGEIESRCDVGSKQNIPNELLLPVFYEKRDSRPAKWMVVQYDIKWFFPRCTCTLAGVWDEESRWAVLNADGIALSLLTPRGDTPG